MAVFNSSTEVIASMFLWSAFLSRSHIFSIIFISGDCAGQESDFILFLSLYSTVHRALWTGALSSWKMKSSDGKYLATIATSVLEFRPLKTRWRTAAKAWRATVGLRQAFLVHCDVCQLAKSHVYYISCARVVNYQSCLFLLCNSAHCTWFNAM